MITLLRLVRAIVGIVAAWQLVALYPAISWAPHIAEVTGQMWALFLLHIVVLAVFGFGFSMLRKIINRLNSKRTGASQPLLAAPLSL